MLQVRIWEVQITFPRSLWKFDFEQCVKWPGNVPALPQSPDRFLSY